MSDHGQADPASVAAVAIADALSTVVGSRVQHLGPGDPVTPGGADVWILVPEPNYWSATQMLTTVETASAGDGVLVLRHVGWPSANRDFYPDPGRLPPHAVHPHTTGFAVRPGAGAPGVGGVRPAPGAAWAIREGGPGNGVGAALDDFLAAHPTRAVRRLSLGTGIAVVWSTQAATAHAVAERLGTWCDDDVLASVDEERRALLTRVAQLEADLVEAGDAGPRLRGENARLRTRVQDMERALDDIARDAEQLGFSSVLRAVDAAERAARRRRPGASFRQRLLVIRDRAVDARRDA